MRLSVAENTEKSKFVMKSVASHKPAIRIGQRQSAAFSLAFSPDSLAVLKNQLPVPR